MCGGGRVKARESSCFHFPWTHRPTETGQIVRPRVENFNSATFRILVPGPYPLNQLLYCAPSPINHLLLCYNKGALLLLLLLYTGKEEEAAARLGRRESSANTVYWTHANFHGNVAVTAAAVATAFLPSTPRARRTRLFWYLIHPLSPSTVTTVGQPFVLCMSLFQKTKRYRFFPYVVCVCVRIRTTQTT